MANELTIIENQWLRPLAPRFDAVLGGIMTSSHLIQSMLVSCERNPKLLEADRQSLLNAAMTFANLRLPVDGATGQAFLLPFKDNKKGITVVQPVIGYKGFNTIGARGGLTITAGVVREGDHEWDYLEGTSGFVRHKVKLDNTGRVIAAWAVAESRTRPPAVKIVGIGYIEEIKKRSPAVKCGADSPWTDPKVGFIAMAEKTPKRMLARVLPFEIDDGRFHKAARLDEAFDEQGRTSYIRDDGNLMIEGESPIAQRESSETPSAEVLTQRVDPEYEQLYAEGERKAMQSVEALSNWWQGLTKPQALKLRNAIQGLREWAIKVEKEGQ